MMETNSDSQKLAGSFRDPSGFVYRKDGVLYRQINRSYQKDYDHLMNSGLYDVLVRGELLVPHIEVKTDESATREVYKIIRPEELPFISYPYEWCFSQLKGAAMATLAIQKKALEHGMSLKDASAYNIQFKDGKPIHIDTLSFQIQQAGLPWVAYKQFCQHFLAPLALAKYSHFDLTRIMTLYSDGIPLDIASQLLPWNSYLSGALILHVHMHAKSMKRFANKQIKKDQSKLRSAATNKLVDSLENAVQKIKWTYDTDVWTAYYDEIHYSEEAFVQKQEIIDRLIDRIKPGTVWDLGANTGLFSRMSSQKGCFTLSLDGDPNVVEANYLECRKKSETNILPLVMDLTNPSPASGWHCRERMSLFDRSKNDTVLALALIHHLTIGNNVPLDKLALFFDKLASNLIIEFVPKTDPKVQQLLSSRDDIFPDYNQRSFELAFEKFFKIVEVTKISASDRVLYLMSK